MIKNQTTIKKAFSLVEIIVGLGVISIVLIIFTNAMITAMRVSLENAARSTVREEVSTSLSLLTKDIREANVVEGCAGGSESCAITSGNNDIRWEICDDTALCKYVDAVEVFRTDQKILIETLTFEQGITSLDSNTRSNILLTIVARHSNARIEIGPIVRQTSVSTRNYEL